MTRKSTAPLNEVTTQEQRERIISSTPKRPGSDSCDYKIFDKGTRISDLEYDMDSVANRLLAIEEHLELGDSQKSSQTRLDFLENISELNKKDILTRIDLLVNSLKK